MTPSNDTAPAPVEAQKPACRVLGHSTLRVFNRPGGLWFERGGRPVLIFPNPSPRLRRAWLAAASWAGVRG